MDTSTANEIIANSDIIGVVLPSNISTCVFEQVAADNNDNMKTLLTVTGQPTPQHWSFFFKEIDGSPLEFSTVYTFRKNVHYTIALCRVSCPWRDGIWLVMKRHERYTPSSFEIEFYNWQYSGIVTKCQYR